MAIMNSVASRAPRCCVSAKFHIRPKISFGNLARSKICLAVSPVRQFVSYTCKRLNPALIKYPEEYRSLPRPTCQTTM